jgi:hypothetical protein
MATQRTRLIALVAALAAYGWCAAPGQAATALASLENPQPNSFQSGIGLLSGWSCSGPDIAIVVDGKTTLAMPYGSARADTASACGGNTSTGFGLLINFNTLGPGTHTARLLVNGAPAGDTQFTVNVPAGEFMTGMSKEITIMNFPLAGKSTVLTWQQSQQNFALKSTAAMPSGGSLDGATLFTTYCVCHSGMDRYMTTEDQIKGAIGSVNDMAALAFLTDAQIQAISVWLSTDEAMHTH